MQEGLTNYDRELIMTDIEKLTKRIEELELEQDLIWKALLKYDEESVPIINKHLANKGLHRGIKRQYKY